MGKDKRLALSGSAPWKGLTVGGVATAAVIAFGLWVGGVFDPLDTLKEVVVQNDAGATDGAEPEDAEATDGATSTTATTGKAASDTSVVTAGSDTADGAASDAGRDSADKSTGGADDSGAAQADVTRADGTDTTAEAGSGTADAGTEAASPDDGMTRGDTADAGAPSVSADASDAEAGSDTTTAADTTGTPSEAAAATGGDTTAVTENSADSTATGTTTGTAADQLTPSFDIVRMEQDGAALVAGVAAPGSMVELLLNGVVVGSETAGSDGKFVSFLDIPASDTARVLTLRMAGVTGAIASAQEVILGPSFAPATSDAVQTAGNGTSDGGGEKLAALSEGAQKAMDQAGGAAAPVADGSGQSVTATADAQTGGQTTTAASAAEDVSDRVVASGAGAAAVADQAVSADAGTATATDPATTAGDPARTAVADVAKEAAAAESGESVGQVASAGSAGSADAQVASAGSAGSTDAQASAGSSGTTGGQGDATAAPQVEASAAAGDAVQGEVKDAPADATSQASANNDTAPAKTAGTTDRAQAQTTTADATATEPPAAPNPVAPTILLSDKDGVKVLQAPGATGDEVALQAISYASDGSARVTGRGQPGGVVRVYLDDGFVTEARIGADGNWVLDLPQAQAGLLRIDEVAADGSVRSRIETAVEGAAPAATAAAATAQAAPATAASTSTTPPTNRYAGITKITVEKGSTLWAIAREKYGEGLMYVRVFEANRDLIRNPDLIYPGQVFNLPD